MKVKFLGHAALLIEGSNFKALIDPFLKNNPAYKQDKTDIQGITHIFITHAHSDHIGDAVEIAKANSSMIVCCAELANLLRMKHKELKVHPMHIGGTFTFNFGKVKMTPAIHGSSLYDDGKLLYAGVACGFVIHHQGKKVYHAGDTALTFDMKLLDKENIDVAFLPIGGNYTMDIDDAVRAVNFINPQLTVPMHFNTFPAIKKDPQEFIKKTFGHKVKLLNSGESITI